MKTPEQIRIETKLKLWSTPGFFQFINDLANEMNYYTLDLEMDKVKRKYEKRLEELNPETKFKQGKLPL